MAFVIDKEELKPGLIIFRRADVAHRNWYCRVKLPKADRYKTVSLKTADINVARTEAYQREVRMMIRLEEDLPVFNRPFRDVAEEFIKLQAQRAQRKEISAERVKKIRSIVNAQLGPYVGSTQIDKVGPDRWENYPAWRRGSGEGRMARPGYVRAASDEEKAAAKAQAEARAKEAARRGRDAPPVADKTEWVIVSDATIRFEMSIFRAIMGYAVAKRYAPAHHRFEGKPALEKLRRDEFTLEEYRHLHTYARNPWIKEAKGETSLWYRQMAYVFILIMCNTGMRPSEARNLRWRDVTYTKDKDGKEVVVLSVRGKGKTRKLVAPSNVCDFIGRVEKLAKAKNPHDPVFSTINGKPTSSLYKALVEDLLTEAGLRDGPNGIPRSTYSFRHTYATLRLSEGVDVYFLAEQMGTSVKMIEDHYGHINTIKYADRVLQGMHGWDPVEETTGADKAPPKNKKALPKKAAKTAAAQGAARAAAKARDQQRSR